MTEATRVVCAGGDVIGSLYSLRSGMIVDYTQSTLDRFWSKINKTDGCWNWLGKPSDKGYGRITLAEGITMYAHCASYELHNEPIPKDLVVDHLCRNTMCVNPEHLEVVTYRVNTGRGMAPWVIGRETNLCPRGHSYNDAYLQYDEMGNIVRKTCRPCVRASIDKHRAKARLVRVICDFCHKEMQKPWLVRHIKKFHQEGAIL